MCVLFVELIRFFCLGKFVLDEVLDNEVKVMVFDYECKVYFWVLIIIFLSCLDIIYDNFKDIL